MTAPTKRDFANALKQALDEAQAGGLSSVEITAGDLHRKVGSYPGPDNRMASCSDVMWEHKLDQDEILYQPPKGRGASLQIRYKLPRPAIPEFPTSRLRPSVNRIDVRETRDRRRIEQNLETYFGPYWFRFDETVRKLLVDTAILKESRDFDLAVWVGPLAKALERVLHSVAAPRLATSIAKWPEAPKAGDGRRKLPEEWMIGDFSRFFWWVTSRQEGQKAFEIEMGALPQLNNLGRIRNLAIHDADQSVTRQEADQFYRELMGAATGRSLLVELYDVFGKQSAN